MRSPPPVPPLRSDVRLKKVQTAQGPRIVVEDPVRKVRVPIDELTLGLMEMLADGPMSQDDLASELEAPRIELQKRTRLLNRQLMLATPRAEAMATLHAEAEQTAIDVSSQPLRFTDGLRHGCVACGACCHGTDVGPLRPEDVDHVMAIDWGPHLPPDVTRDDWVVAVEHPDAKAPIHLMGHRHGRCVFLGTDKLCVIHKVAGPQQKPTICRQFPYTFTRTPSGIDVSFSMECRAWWTAKQAGRPPAEDEAAIRKLLDEDAPVLSLPLPVPIFDGLAWDAATWELVRAETLAAIARADSMPALSQAIVTPVRDAVTRMMAVFSDSEVFAERAAWGVPEPDEVDHAAAFFATLGRLRSTLDTGLGEIGTHMREHDRPEEADRVQRLRWATTALLDGRRCDDLLRFPHELEIWQDMCRAAFAAHEPARRGGLVQGVATLGLRLLSGHLLSGLLATTALRGRTSEADATDAMVLVTKMWRGTAFERLLHSARADLIAVFFWQSGVLAAGEAPRALPAWVA